MGTGPNPNSMEYVTLLANGLLLATSATDGLILVDPATGDRTWVTGSEDAWVNGGVFREGVQANPEPSAVVVGIVGLMAMFGGRGRRGRAASRPPAASADFAR